MRRDWLIGVGIAVAALLGSWGLLIVAAKRLPPGILPLERFLDQARMELHEAPPLADAGAQCSVLRSDRPVLPSAHA